MDVIDKLENLSKDLNTIIGYIKGQVFKPILTSEGKKIFFPNAKNEKTELDKRVDFKAVKGEKMPPKYQDGSFRQKQSGIFEYRFRHLDNYKSVYGHSKEDCWKKRTDILAGKTKKKESTQIPTFSEWLDKWYAIYKQPYNGDRSLLIMRGYIKRIKAELGDVKLNKLNGLQLQEYINKHTETPNTQRKIGNIIRGSLRKAVALQIIKFNPFEPVELLPVNYKHYQALQISEQRTIYQETEGKYRILFNFCCCTGIRISRALSLERKDFSENTREITVLKKQRKGKTDTYRVPYLPELLELPESGKIFPSITYNSAKLYFKRLYKRLGITGITIHSFRHTFISCCYHLGYKPKQIQKFAGHASLDMTMNTYTHLLKEQGSSPILDYLQRLKNELLL